MSLPSYLSSLINGFGKKQNNLLLKSLYLTYEEEDDAFAGVRKGTRVENFTFF